MNTILQFISDNPVVGQIGLVLLAGLGFYKAMPGLLKNFNSHGKK